MDLSASSRSISLFSARTPPYTHLSEHIVFTYIFNLLSLLTKNGTDIVAWDVKKTKQVHDAGHMVPMDQPKAALEMLKRWTQGKLSEPSAEPETLVAQM